MTELSILSKIYRITTSTRMCLECIVYVVPNFIYANRGNSSRAPPVSFCAIHDMTPLNASTP